MINKEGLIGKGWGYEKIFASNDKYCGKFLVFNKPASRCSMHFHANKHETWYVASGSFLVEWINTDTTVTHNIKLEKGDTWVNEPLFPHRIICIKPGTIIEVSTPDHAEDNYKIASGDSQSG